MNELFEKLEVFCWAFGVGGCLAEMRTLPPTSPMGLVADAFAVTARHRRGGPLSVSPRTDAVLWLIIPCSIWAAGFVQDRMDYRKLAALAVVAGGAYCWWRAWQAYHAGAAAY